MAHHLHRHGINGMDMPSLPLGPLSRDGPTPLALQAFAGSCDLRETPLAGYGEMMRNQHNLFKYYRGTNGLSKSYTAMTPAERHREHLRHMVHNTSTCCSNPRMHRFYAQVGNESKA